MPVLDVRNVTKRFPGVTALHRVSFTLEPGEVHCLVGENGAGKSTLIKIISGALQPDEGTLILDGKQLFLPTPHSALRTGIATIFQESNLVPELDVAGNILLGREPRRKRLPLLDRTAMRRLAEEALRLVQEPIDPALKARDLTPSQHQMVEIAKALSRNARIVILDEPTAALTEHETRNLFSVIRRLSSQGVSFVYISHRLEEIFEIGDRITVLRDGAVVGGATPKQTSERELVKMMVGREIEQSSGQHAGGSTQKEILRVSGLSAAHVHDCTFTLHRGEILGIAGLVGSGRTELARCLFGADARISGTVLLEGTPFHPRSPREAIDIGLAFLTEDRNTLGLFPERSIIENVSISRLRELTGRLFIRRDNERQEVHQLADRFGVRHAGLDTEVATLSGGNRQKVLLARSVGLRPKVIIFDEPTAGIDVGAKSEIHDQMRELAAAGTGVIVISSELPELLSLCSHILVMRNGTIVGSMDRAEATEEALLHLATGTEQ